MIKNSTFLILLIVATLACCSSTNAQSDAASQSADDDMPFGEITDSDADQLMEFARLQGFDLSSELQKAYAKDTNAIAMSWQPVRDARNYLVQCASMVNGVRGEWRLIDVGGKSTLTLNDMTVGTAYVFRLAAGGGRTGISDWSPEVLRTAA